MSNSIPSIFGSRAIEYFKAAKEKGTYVQNKNGNANKDNINMLRHDVSSGPGKNAYGGKVDIKA